MSLKEVRKERDVTQSVIQSGPIQKHRFSMIIEKQQQRTTSRVHLPVVDLSRPKFRRDVLHLIEKGVP